MAVTNVTTANAADEAVVLTPELITELDRPGPRYTSYPPVPYWSEQFGPADYRRLLATAAAREREPLNLYVHIPFCAHRCLFCGCNVVVSHSRQRTDAYLAALARELATVAGLLGARRRVCQLQLGGGTPTHLTPNQLSELMEAVRACFELTDGAELALEAHPAVTTPAHLARLAELGFNRLSFGVQDFDPRVQAAVKRPQSVAQTRMLVERARELGIDRINLDLMYGLPHQNHDGFGATLDEVLRLRPDRLALFSFAYLPDRLRHQRLLPDAALPDAAGKLELFMQARERLLAAGYLALGFDHYCLPHDELAQAMRDNTLRRGFMGYTPKGGSDLIGVGLSAISDLGGGYAQNHTGLRAWSDGVAAEGLATHRGVALSARDRLVRHAIMEWLCQLQLDLRALTAAHGPAARELLAQAQPELEALAARGLVRRENGLLRATPLGRLFARVVAMALDPRLREASSAQFSRTV